jgi:LysM repeat protein
MKRLAALLAVVAVVLTACLGGGDNAKTTDPSAETLGPIAIDTSLGIDTDTTVDPLAETTVDPLNPTLPSSGITTVAPGTGSTISAAPTTVASSGGAVDSGQTYTVVANDNLSKIATTLGVTRADVMALNGIVDPDKVFIGQKLKVPTKRPATTTTKAPGTATTKASASGAGTYTVKSGENLTKIAKDLGVTMTALMAANGITDPDKIRSGQVLQVPAKTAATATTTKATTATTAATATTVTVAPATTVATTATTVAATTTKASTP